MSRFKKNILIIGALLWVWAMPASAQDYKSEIAAWRNQYIKDLLAEPRQPVKPGDERYLDFYPPDASYRVTASFQMAPGAAPIMVPTHSGKNKPFRLYGTLTFTIHDTDLTLSLYQPIDIVSGAPRKDELFLPFNDLTNYESTFGGGRYIDLNISDIHDGMVELDFNKCYNPYCAFAEGFSCPIPPDENRLKIEIRAGEKMFTKYLGR